MDADRFEAPPLDTVWLYRESIEDGAPEWLLVAAAKEIDRLREHVKTLHRLNGYSMQKGWWCSCGEIIQPSWVRYRPDENSPALYPWSDAGRQIARALHDKHVGIMTFGGAS